MLSTSLEGKSVFVTGAGSGMGQSFARIAAGAGARVALYDLNAESLDSLAADLKANGSEVLWTSGDVSNAHDVESALAKSAQMFGSLDCAFNNAGIAGSPARLAQHSDEAWDRTISVNLRGVYLCVKHQLRLMQAQRSGAIVNSSSVGAHRGHRDFAAVCASKAGVEALTRVAAMEAAEFGVRVNAIAPGLIDTPANKTAMDPERLQSRIQSEIPLRRMGTSDEVTGLVLWLLSDHARYVTGQTFVSDGGLLAK